MTDVFKTFGSDASLEQSGVWVEIEGKRFKIARAGGSNLEFAKAMRKKIGPFQRAIQNDRMDEIIARKLVREVFVDTVLKNWEGVEGPDGPIPYSKENALMLLEKLPNLMFLLQQKAEQFETFQQEEIEDDAKN